MNPMNAQNSCVKKTEILIRTLNDKKQMLKTKTTIITTVTAVLLLETDATFTEYIRKQSRF